METIKLDISGPIANLHLCRPSRSNAFNAQMIVELNAAFTKIAASHSRALIISAEGKHFCAGADLEWMKETAQLTNDENKRDAIALAMMFEGLNQLSIPTIAAVKGAAFGGAVGLLACCDIVIAEQNAICCLSEVKIGLVPATIAPHVIRVIGSRQMRRYALTAERFTADTAKKLGLVHQICEIDDSYNQAQSLAQSILKNAPAAVIATKQLIQDLDTMDSSQVIEHTSALIAQVRTSEEGQRGLNGFIDGKLVDWEASQ